MTIMYETMSCFGQMFVGALFGSSNVQPVYVIQSIQASLQITYAYKLDLP